MLKIFAPKNKIVAAVLDIPSSKSISNRALIIQALSNEKIALEKISISDDTNILLEALEKIKARKNNNQTTINIGLAGTAFRFLTAFLATQKGEFVLTGAQRIQERPIKPLVDALKKLGADISYLNVDGFAPLSIKGKPLLATTIAIDADISSQFISALLLIAPSFNKAFSIKLLKKINSKPYLEMTLSLMKHFGISSTFVEETIHISKAQYKQNVLFVEADWSSASYFYMCLALAKNGEIVLKNYKQNSIQGDAKLAALFVAFGVKTIFGKNEIRLVKSKLEIDFFEYDFSKQPDLAQTFIALCVGLNIEAQLTGLESLKIKETDRISAMQTEISKLGWRLQAAEKKGVFLLLHTGKRASKNIIFETYKDHRMAMSLAPLCLKFENISIKNPEVVSKSNPLFWEHLKSLSFEISDVR